MILGSDYERQEGPRKHQAEDPIETKPTEFKSYFNFENLHFHCLFRDNRYFIQIIAVSKGANCTDASMVFLIVSEPVEVNGEHRGLSIRPDQKSSTEGWGRC